MSNLYIGLMSGTSLDGVDAVLVSIENDECKMQKHHFIDMPNDLKDALQQICLGQETNLQRIGELDHRLGLLYARVVNELLAKSKLNAQDIVAIGNHGQTVFHHPQHPYPYTIQLGDANIIAIQTGITTIADFRRKDMALGGQGAPLVPAFHRYLFKQKMSTLDVVLNIGGISNISVIDEQASVIGFDTGPGNTLLDAWCFKHTGKAYDKDGVFAKQGRVNSQLLDKMLLDAYFYKPAPKSTGREHFHLAWLQEHINSIDGSNLAPQDIQATLVELTVQSIALHLKKINTKVMNKRLYVCGGGVHNPLIMQGLKTALQAWSVKSTQKIGVSPDYMEAIAFAWLAYRRMQNLPSNLPQATGASRETSLGVIYLAD